MEGHGIRHYFTAVEPRGKTDLKAAARQAIKDGWASRLRGNARTRLHEELGKECSHQLVWILTCTDPSSVDECHGCGLLDVPSAQTVDTSHRLRRASLTNIRASAHTQDVEWCHDGDLVHVWRKVKRNNTEARRVLVTLRWFRWPALPSWSEMRGNVFVSYRGRVTNVALEFFAKG